MIFALFLVYLSLSYLNPGEVFPALAPYRVTYWVGMIGLVIAFGSLITRRGGPAATLQLWFLITFTLLMGVSLMVADRWIGAPIFALQRFGPSLTMFVLAICGIDSLRKLRIATMFIVLSSLILVAEGILAFHFGYNKKMFLFDPTTRGEYAYWADGADSVDAGSADDESADDDAVDDESEGSLLPRIRGLGSMHDPNDLAADLVVAVALLVSGWRKDHRLRNIVVVVLPAAALAYGVFLTRSRGGAVALVVLLWRAAVGRVGRVPAVILLVLLGAGIAGVNFGGGRSLTGNDNDSASDRVTAWTEGFEMLKSQPMLGVGYGQFLDHHDITAHNSLVLCFAETGLVGCFFWIGLLVITFLELRRLKQLPGTEPLDRSLASWANVLQLALIGFLTACFFLSRTFVPTLYLLIGLAVGLALVARQANRPISLPILPQLGGIIFACELGSIAIVYLVVKLRVV